MGAFGFSSSNTYEKCTDTTPNPNKYNFNIEKIIRGNNYDYVEVKYYNCTTFNGKKILLVKRNTLNFSDSLWSNKH